MQNNLSTRSAKRLPITLSPQTRYLRPHTRPGCALLPPGDILTGTGGGEWERVGDYTSLRLNVKSFSSWHYPGSRLWSNRFSALGGAAFRKLPFARPRRGGRRRCWNRAQTWPLKLWDTTQRCPAGAQSCEIRHLLAQFGFASSSNVLFAQLWEYLGVRVGVEMEFSRGYHHEHGTPCWVVRALMPWRTSQNRKTPRSGCCSCCHFRWLLLLLPSPAMAMGCSTA